MIEVRTLPGQKILELGCGENRHPQATCAVDIRPLPNVDFQVDFNQLPMPIADNEWDGIICMYCLEHLPFANVIPFLEDVKRVMKPGAKAVFAVPNTEAQQQWIKDHPEGWDGKDLFTASSELLFGSQSYDENYHASAFTPMVACQLFQKAGFHNVITHPYNPRNTDLVIEAIKPTSVNGQQQSDVFQEKSFGPSGAIPSGYLESIGRYPIPSTEPTQVKKLITSVKVPNELIQKQSPSREELFDKTYFNGGQKFGGYKADAWGAFRDFPVHETTFRHILARKPESVLEVGAARGYLVKRLQDIDIQANGLEISKHCHMTRVCDEIIHADICKPWPMRNAPQGWTEGHNHPDQFDLCVSVATLEHIPEEFLPAVIGEMKRTCKRGLHGIDFGQHDDGFDKTHCTLRPKEWWQNTFSNYAPGWPVEILDKEELERTPPNAGGNPFWDMNSYLNGDGKSKWNLGSFTTQFHHGWMNADIHDLSAFAQPNGYRFQRIDLKQSIPVSTGTVDLLLLHHVIEHFTYVEALSILRECRRVIHPNGAMRLVTPDAYYLMHCYFGHDSRNRPTIQELESILQEGNIEIPLSQFDEINDNSAAAPTPLRKLWELLMGGHAAIYDQETLANLLDEAGWIAKPASFRQTEVEQVKQILRECVEMPFGGLSLFMDAVPKLG